MATQVGICNAALIKIGARTIMALDGATKESRLCLERFDDIRDEVIRDHPWNFSIKRVTLAQLAEVPQFGYSYQYQLPSDCLRVLVVNDGESEYVIEGRRILSNEESIELIYCARITDTTLYDASFVNALGFRLAAELAYPITSSKGLSEAMMQGYRTALQSAKTKDASEGYPKGLYSDEFINIRY